MLNPNAPGCSTRSRAGRYGRSRSAWHSTGPRRPRQPLPVRLGAIAWYGRGLGLLAEGGAPAGDTEPIALLLDLTGNGHHAVQETEALRPVLDADALNGYPAIVYNGSTQYSALPRMAGAFADGYTVLAVCRFSDGRTGSTQRPWGAGVVSPAAGYVEMTINATGGTPLAMMRPGTTRSATFGTGLLPDGLTNWHMFATVATPPPGGSIVSYLDGSPTPVQTTPTVEGDEWSTPTADLESLLLGATRLNAGISGFSPLHLVEWLYFPRPLLAHELAALHEFVGATYDSGG